MMRMLGGHPDRQRIPSIGLVAQDKGLDTLGGQELDLMPQGLQRSGPVVGSTANLHGDERLLTLGKECAYLVALELMALNFGRFGIDRVELKHVLGDIHTDDGQHLGRWHGGTSGHEAVAMSGHCATSTPLQRALGLCSHGVPGEQRRCRWRRPCKFP
jgi:hypothetical protein